MTTEAWEIVVEPGSDLERRLAEMPSDKPGVLIAAGHRFSVQRRDVSAQNDAPIAPWLNRPAAPLPEGRAFDRERFRQGLAAVKGMLSDDEAERRVRDIYRWREEGTRPWS